MIMARVKRIDGGTCLRVVEVLSPRQKIFLSASCRVLLIFAFLNSPLVLFFSAFKRQKRAEEREERAKRVPRRGRRPI